MRVKNAFKSLTKSVIRRRVVNDGVRMDGRSAAQLRPVSAEVGILPTAHGSGLFQRGETQVLNVLTLGMPKMDQLIDTLALENKKRYMHHYNMPPYANGETGRMGGTKRREVGHGMLAERALLPVVPSKEDWPYALRLVSEVLSSNGSTSMASVCSSSLSLMDGGVGLSALGLSALGLSASGPTCCPRATFPSAICRLDGPASLDARPARLPARLPVRVPALAGQRNRGGRRPQRRRGLGTRAAPALPQGTRGDPHIHECRPENSGYPGAGPAPSAAMPNAVPIPRAMLTRPPTREADESAVLRMITVLFAGTKMPSPRPARASNGSAGSRQRPATTAAIPTGTFTQ